MFDVINADILWLTIFTINNNNVWAQATARKPTIRLKTSPGERLQPLVEFFWCLHQQMSVRKQPGERCESLGKGMHQ